MPTGPVPHVAGKGRERCPLAELGIGALYAKVASLGGDPARVDFALNEAKRFYLEALKEDHRVHKGAAPAEPGWAHSLAIFEDDLLTLEQDVWLHFACDGIPPTRDGGGASQVPCLIARARAHSLSHGAHP